MAIMLRAPKADKLRLSELVDVTGFAEMAGVKPLTIHAYRKIEDRGVPDPVAYIGNVPVWTRKQVHAWLATRPGQGNRNDLAS